MKNLVIGVKITEGYSPLINALLSDQDIIEAVNETKKYVTSKMFKVFDLSDKVITEIEFDNMNKKMYTYVDAIYTYDSEFGQIFEETPEEELDEVLNFTKFCLKQEIQIEFGGNMNIDIMFDVVEDDDEFNE